MDSRMTPIEEIKNIITSNQKRDQGFRNFVLQGGAGSGKTETLKQVIEFISENYPEKKILCITLTNTAVDEIKSRVGDNHLISTIHSFLNLVIKDYKRNIHQIIHTIFCLKNVVELAHSDYKEKYRKYTDKVYFLNKTKSEKVTGKKDYDKNPEDFNSILNEKIDSVNLSIVEQIKTKDYSSIRYNETRFDKFEELTFGHEKLLEVSLQLFREFEILGKIVSDKFDFILIDEYQDTNEKVIDIFLNYMPANRKTTIGLFGDSMQGIYDNGIGDIDKQVLEGKIVKIEKEDNYRCSEEVIDFINLIRNDGIKQKVAYKQIKGEFEKESDRKGRVSLFYSLYPSKPNSRSPIEEKDAYFFKLKQLINASTEGDQNFKKLMLTNKSISSEIGFSKLFKIYDDRYTEVKEEIERDLQRLQFMDLLDLLKAYSEKNYNFILSELKKNGFILKTAEDKIKIKEVFDYLVSTTESAYVVMEYAIKNDIIKRSLTHENFLARKDTFLQDIKNDPRHDDLKRIFLAGATTAVQMAKVDIGISEDEFNDFLKKHEKQCFYKALFSEDLKFFELVNYYNYLNEGTEYITMHKTKGSGIEKVVVVLEEYFWTKYNFKSIYMEGAEYDDKRARNQKIFYVACSRAIKDLVCVRFVEDEEEEMNLLKLFKGGSIKKINLSSI